MTENTNTEAEYCWVLRPKYRYCSGIIIVQARTFDDAVDKINENAAARSYDLEYETAGSLEDLRQRVEDGEIIEEVFCR